MSRNLEPGMTFPDFTFPDETGAKHRLSTLQGDDVMVVHLSRGEHCPRERMHHRELLRFHEWCAVAFTQLVTVMPNELHDVYKMKIATGANWTFLADEELEARSHFEIEEYTDVHHDYAVVPHTVILSPGLVIEKVYVGYWFWGRPSPEQLWTDLGEIHARIKPDFDPTLPEPRAEWEEQVTPPPSRPRSPAADLRLSPVADALINGIRIYYEEHGGGDPILCIHGGGSSALMWEEAFGQLARLGRVIAYDRRGCTRSERPNPYEHTTVAEQAADAAALLQARADGPAVVVRRSYGGAVAVDMALGYPDRVRALVLLEGDALGVSPAGLRWTREVRERLRDVAVRDGVDAV